MDKKEIAKDECGRIMTELSDYSGDKLYHFALGLQAGIIAGVSVVAADEDIRYSTEYQDILSRATEIVDEFDAKKE